MTGSRKMCQRDASSRNLGMKTSSSFTLSYGLIRIDPGHREAVIRWSSSLYSMIVVLDPVTVDQMVCRAQPSVQLPPPHWVVHVHRSDPVSDTHAPSVIFKAQYCAPCTLIGGHGNCEWSRTDPNRADDPGKGLARRNWW